MLVHHEGHLARVGLAASPLIGIILRVDGLPDAVAQFYLNFVNLEIVGQRVVNVRVVHVDGVQVRLHLQEVKGDHLAAEALRSLILEEPFRIVRPSVE